MKNPIIRIIRRIRLSFLLITTYVRANRRLFITSLLIGAAAIFFSPQIQGFLEKRVPPVTGFAGNYTLATLPLPLQRELSFGLTRLTREGQATAGAALSWEQSDDNRKMVFHLDERLFWQDGKRFTSSQVSYKLVGVEVKKLSNFSLEFTLKEPFAPLPVIVSQPLFRPGLIGLGEYQLENVKMNGRFVNSINLRNINDGSVKRYRFYPSEFAAATGLRLGEISSLESVHETFNFEQDSHYRISKRVDYTSVATLYFNNHNQFLEDKVVRQALTYALPNDFSVGERAFSAIPPNNWTHNQQVKKYPQNLELAKKTIAKEASGSAKIKLRISAQRNLSEIANTVSRIWESLGVQTEIQLVDIRPNNFDVYIKYMDIPVDPDQYALWHSTQTGNITGYKSARVDRLLEDGRKATKQADRKTIYQNFQRAISEDVPAVFLFYPSVYEITRK